MIPRLYCSSPLALNQPLQLGSEEVHYLRNVLRREVGAEVILFNERDGEFGGSIADLGKKAGIVALTSQRRGPPTGIGHEVTLAFAPVKRQPVETIIQKGTELGVTRFVPVLTARTNSDRLRNDRLNAIAKEAAEQSERLSVPIVEPAIALAKFLTENEGVTTIFCDEAGDDPTQKWGGSEGRALPLLAAVDALEPCSAVILIGPEGGFTEDEREILRTRNGTLAVTLGPRILRADTAAITALALWQAAKGDLSKS